MSDRCADALVLLSGWKTCTWHVYRPAAWLTVGFRTTILAIVRPRRGTTSYDCKGTATDEKRNPISCMRTTGLEKTLQINVNGWPSTNCVVLAERLVIMGGAAMASEAQ